MNRQSLLIIAIIASGSILSGLAYGVTNGSIIVGDLTVTGNCTGCGGSLIFSSWGTVVLDGTVSDGGNVVQNSEIDNNGNFVFMTGGVAPTSWFERINGTNTSYSAASFQAFDGVKIFSQSSDGKYQAIYDDSTHKIHITNNGTSLYDITLDFATKYNAGNAGSVSISPNGKYVGFAYDDFADHSKTRYQTFRGS